MGAPIVAPAPPPAVLGGNQRTPREPRCSRPTTDSETSPTQPHFDHGSRGHAAAWNSLAHDQLFLGPSTLQRQGKGGDAARRRASASRGSSYGSHEHRGTAAHACRSGAHVAPSLTTCPSPDCAGEVGCAWARPVRSRLAYSRCAALLPWLSSGWCARPSSSSAGRASGSGVPPGCQPASRCEPDRAGGRAPDRPVRPAAPRRRTAWHVRRLVGPCAGSRTLDAWRYPTVCRWPG
jgi:hypothetical protein